MRCEACGAAIPGRYKEKGFPAKPFTRPAFCRECGGPYAWAGRQERLYELENQLDKEDLDEADRLQVHEQLAALRDSDDMTEEEEQRRWLMIKSLAPGLISGGGRILESVISAAVKEALGL